MLPISNVAIPNLQFQLELATLALATFPQWQHFHSGNILKVILIYIPVRSEGGGLTYNFHVTCFFLLSLLGDREAWSFGVFFEDFPQPPKLRTSQQRKQRVFLQLPLLIIMSILSKRNPQQYSCAKRRPSDCYRSSASRISTQRTPHPDR